MPQSNKVQLKVVPKSSFPGKMHFNRGTAKVGSLVPLLIDELIPNTTVDIKQALNVSLPPLASDTFMSVDYCVEAFFVPMRLLYKGFESWFTQRPQKPIVVLIRMSILQIMLVLILRCLEFILMMILLLFLKAI